MNSSEIPSELIDDNAESQRHLAASMATAAAAVKKLGKQIDRDRKRDTTRNCDRKRFGARWSYSKGHRQRKQ